ncbi:ABC transporter permease subunit [Halobacillus litoralis]|uniref:ABC transporter permease subunit n=1 Tax=Halobacillus litoralis TaxID=45668 RepID=A0A845DME1_9BACI|nr:MULTISPECIES: sugar ABC transporter permease [Halobacillus]MYL18660.1 ABC transporter permease subunit [Halobacillus litoralis]MYL31593.1 ABC transporter permease subunit [Halobacillus halophilus]
MGPAIFIISVFIIAPILYALFLSVNNVQLLGGTEFKFSGLENYTRMIDDERALISLKNTAEYVLIVVPVQVFLALILAATLNSNIKGKNIFRIIFFLPTVTSSAVLTLIFMWIYNPNGLLNSFLTFINLPTYDWLSDPNIALKSIMIMNIWATAPFFMIIYLAAMQDIPESLYEAATIDGANWWQKFTKITIPMLKPVTFFAVVMSVIGTFQLFDQSYIFSGGSGGPNNSTLTIVLLIYQYAFRSLEMGYASALAVVLAVIILAVTIIQRVFFKEEKLHD